MPSKSPRPQIDRVFPAAAIPGGEFHIIGKGLMADARPVVNLGEVEARLVIGSDSMLVARVPDEAQIGDLTVTNASGASPLWHCDLGIQVADNLHPVANPAVDEFGNVYTTFSGARGQKTPVAVYKLDLNHALKPFVTDLMNATGLAFSPAGVLHVSSRFDGIVYQVNGAGDLSVYCEGMGTATGIAFDRAGNLFVGDRSGTIFKVSSERQIYVFATIEPSISAYHLAFDSADNLYVTGPTTSSFDVIQKITPEGVVTPYFRGLGRPQGMAFDEHDNLYCCSSLAGRRGVVKITPEGKADLFVSGPGIVGLAFTPSRAMMIATNNALYRVDAGIRGRTLLQANSL